MQCHGLTDFFVYTLTFDMGSSFKYNAANDETRMGAAEVPIHTWAVSIEHRVRERCIQLHLIGALIPTSAKN